MDRSILANPKDNASLWAMCITAFLWGLSSLMVFVALPLLMKSMGASNTAIGCMEGIAISVSFVSKILAGVSSDVLKRRKPFILLGSFGSFLVKILFAMSTSLWTLQLSRIIDRLSKGIRTAPADALMADLSHGSPRGKAFGLKQSLWTLGSATGAVLGSILLYLTHNDYSLIFFLASIPSALTLLLIVRFVKEGTRVRSEEQARYHLPLRWQDIQDIPGILWQFFGVVFVLMMARFSEVFLILHAKNVGWTVSLIPLMIVLMDAVHGAVAYFMGPVSDRRDSKQLFMLGNLTLSAATLVFAALPSVSGVILGVCVNALHLGMTQGLMKKIIADHTRPHLQGTAFSLFYLVSGLGVLIGNPLAGYLSQDYGFRATFICACLLSILSSFLIWVIARKKALSVAASEKPVVA